MSRFVTVIVAVATFIGTMAGTPANASTRDFTGISVTASGAGTTLVADTGEVYAFRTRYAGNPTGFSGRIVAVSSTADGQGYAAISSAGQVYAYNVAYHGNPSPPDDTEFVGISVRADGQGYAAITNRGHVYAYNVAYHGNPTGFTGDIVGISVRADGQGYAAISSAGQVYAYNVAYQGNPTPPGDARFVGISVRADGHGYTAITNRGHVYAYNVAYHDNPTGFTGDIVGISVRADGQGYAALSSFGQVYAYNVAHHGNGDPGSPVQQPKPKPDPNHEIHYPVTPRNPGLPINNTDGLDKDDCTKAQIAGIESIQDFLLDTFPGSKDTGIYVCRYIGKTKVLSLHGVGRAADITATDARQREAIMRCLVVNHQVLGLQRVIDEGATPWMAWNARRGTWRESGNGAIPNNLHYEVNFGGAGNKTSPEERPGFDHAACR